MNNMVCLYGASGHGKVIKDIITNQSNHVLAFFDDNPKFDNLQGVVVYNTNRIKDFLSEKFIISIGDNIIRKKVSTDNEFSYTKAIHNDTIISLSVNVNEGTVIMPGVIINSDSIIGKHCIINSLSIIEHDCIIDDYVHISPNTTLCGNVKIGEGSHIGAGATIIPGLTIGKWTTIGAGTVIINDIPDFAVVVGNPGKIIKYNKR
jgi:sugar O-acyltransferase (sialic acid O-acetyltransferase NeuD family)